MAFVKHEYEINVIGRVGLFNMFDYVSYNLVINFFMIPNISSIAKLFWETTIFIQNPFK